jgi:hypothetical protein
MRRRPRFALNVRNAPIPAINRSDTGRESDASQPMSSHEASKSGRCHIHRKHQQAPPADSTVTTAASTTKSKSSSSLRIDSVGCGSDASQSSAITMYSHVGNVAEPPEIPECGFDKDQSSGRLSNLDVRHAGGVVDALQNWAPLNWRCFEAVLWTQQT